MMSMEGIMDNKYHEVVVLSFLVWEDVNYTHGVLFS